MLANILRNHSWKKVVPRRDLHISTVCGRRHCGGEVDESTQEGENKACGLVKGAVLCQMLQHIPAVHPAEVGDTLILLAVEQLETLQALLEAAAPLEDWRPPLTRNTVGPREEFAGGEEPGKILGSDHHGPANASHPIVTSQGGDEEALHVAQFIRRHGPGDALRMASVLYATVGVIAHSNHRT